MDLRPGREQLLRLLPIIALVIGASVLTIGGLLVLMVARDESPAVLFLDTYELTGSRLSGLVQLIGVVLLVAAAAICLFAAGLVSRHDEMARWRRFLYVAAGLTSILAVDDLMAIHELADDLIADTSGFRASGPAKDALELLVLGTYGALFGLWLWRARALVARTEWVLLILAAGLLLASVAVDVAPHAWLAQTLHVSIDAQGTFEDTLKLAGIGIFATYLVRTAENVARAAGTSPRTDDLA